MTALQFNAIKSTFGTVLGNGDIARNDLVDFGVGDGLRYFAKQRIGNCRWRPNGEATEHAARLTAVVIDLGKNRHAMTMNRIGDALVARDHVAMKTMNQFFIGPVGGVGAVLFGDDESGTASGTGGVVVGVLLGGLAIAGVVGEVGAKDDAVSGRHWPEFKRCP